MGELTRHIWRCRRDHVGNPCYIKRKHKKCLRELGGSAIATLHEHIVTSYEFSSNEQRKASGSLGRVCETRLGRTVDARETISKQSRTFNNIIRILCGQPVFLILKSRKS